MILRIDYINLIKPYMNVKIIKILSGIRRCGKSTIFDMLINELESQGIDKEHIIFKKYSNIDYVNYTSEVMYQELKSLILDKDRYYLFLDEVQEIDNWERVINTFFEEYNVDIYVTGSNSKLMSSEISTYLSGRYVSIPVFTLSFKEYLDFKKDIDKPINESLMDYIKMGGFPMIVSSNFDSNVSYKMVEDIFNSIVLNDITKRHNINNIDLFNRTVKFVIENVGKTFSANSVVKFLKSEKRNICVETIYNYLEWLESAFVIYRCKRYDLRGKSVLKTQEKFFIADQSIKYALYGYKSTDLASMLENIVYFELRRRGYEVYIGKDNDKEIDFVGVLRDDKIYIQVFRDLPEDSDREVKNLLNIKDNYPKLIVTLDKYDTGNVDGVKIVYLGDFLLGKY